MCLCEKSLKKKTDGQRFPSGRTSTRKKNVFLSIFMLCHYTYMYMYLPSSFFFFYVYIYCRIVCVTTVRSVRDPLKR